MPSLNKGEYAPVGNGPQLSDVARAPEFQLIQERFANANNMQYELIYEIQEKLHNILNLRELGTQCNGDKIKDPDTFVEHMHYQANSVENANNRLRQILDHIRKII